MLCGFVTLGPVPEGAESPFLWLALKRSLSGVGRVGVNCGSEGLVTFLLVLGTRTAPCAGLLRGASAS